MTTTIKQFRGETNTIEVDYAGKAAPWNDLSLAVVMLTARLRLSDAAPAWATLGAVAGTKAYAPVTLTVPAGIYHVTLSVFLPPGTDLPAGAVDHTAFTLRVDPHAYVSTDDPEVPTMSVDTAANQITAAITAALASTKALLTYTTLTRPAAGAAWLAIPIYVRDADADGEVHLCRQKADGSYEWTVVAF